MQIAFEAVFIARHFENEFPRLVARIVQRENLGDWLIDGELAGLPQFAAECQQSRLIANLRFFQIIGICHHIPFFFVK